MSFVYSKLIPHIPNNLLNKYNQTLTKTKNNIIIYNK